MYRVRKIARAEKYAGAAATRAGIREIYAKSGIPSDGGMSDFEVIMKVHRLRAKSGDLPSALGDFQRRYGFSAASVYLTADFVRRSKWAVENVGAA